MIKSEDSVRGDTLVSLIWMCGHYLQNAYFVHSLRDMIFAENEIQSLPWRVGCLLKGDTRYILSQFMLSIFKILWPFLCCRSSMSKGKVHCSLLYNIKGQEVRRTTNGGPVNGEGNER